MSRIRAGRLCDQPDGQTRFAIRATQEAGDAPTAAGPQRAKGIRRSTEVELRPLLIRGVRPEFSSEMRTAIFPS